MKQSLPNAPLCYDDPPPSNRRLLPSTSMGTRHNPSWSPCARRSSGRRTTSASRTPRCSCPTGRRTSRCPVNPPLPSGTRPEFPDRCLMIGMTPGLEERDLVVTDCKSFLEFRIVDTVSTIKAQSYNKEESSFILTKVYQSSSSRSF